MLRIDVRVWCIEIKLLMRHFTMLGPSVAESVAAFHDIQSVPTVLVYDADNLRTYDLTQLHPFQMHECYIICYAASMDTYSAMNNSVV